VCLRFQWKESFGGGRFLFGSVFSSLRYGIGVLFFTWFWDTAYGVVELGNVGGFR
jgi:hypothetical protein